MNSTTVAKFVLNFALHFSTVQIYTVRR